ncbi:ribonuclease H family protein [Pannonibacter phragmitetus]|uniref:ribonuclease H family protein n=1 Tax=Pannonibacter phragmitetus TaxID=121719 RepID=UPI00067D796E|nr:ribonuclease H [Pannonibacter phragmitetus]
MLPPQEIHSAPLTAALDAIPIGAAVELYTDGACINNPGPSAAAFAVVHGGQVILSGARYLGHGTNNTAELSAALDGLQALGGRRADLSVTLLSDSEQVVKGMRDWLPGWKSRGWRSAAGKPVKNRTLYEELDTIAAVCPALEWKHVRGHAGHEFNELVDGLANAAAEAGQAQSR